jgi:hypothetical protein
MIWAGFIASLHACTRVLLLNEYLLWPRVWTKRRKGRECKTNNTCNTLLLLVSTSTARPTSAADLDEQAEESIPRRARRGEHSRQTSQCSPPFSLHVLLETTAPVQTQRLRQAKTSVKSSNREQRAGEIHASTRFLRSSARGMVIVRKARRQEHAEACRRHLAARDRTILKRPMLPVCTGMLRSHERRDDTPLMLPRGRIYTRITASLRCCGHLALLLLLLLLLL